MTGWPPIVELIQLTGSKSSGKLSDTKTEASVLILDAGSRTLPNHASMLLNRKPPVRSSRKIPQTAQTRLSQTGTVFDIRDSEESFPKNNFRLRIRI